MITKNIVGKKIRCPGGKGYALQTNRYITHACQSNEKIISNPSDSSFSSSWTLTEAPSSNPGSWANLIQILYFHLCFWIKSFVYKKIKKAENKWQQVVKGRHLDPPDDPAAPSGATSGHTPQGSLSSCRGHRDYRCSSHKAIEWNQMFIRRQRNAENVLHRYSGISFSRKQKLNLWDFQDNRWRWKLF